MRGTSVVLLGIVLGLAAAGCNKDPKETGGTAAKADPNAAPVTSAASRDAAAPLASASAAPTAGAKASYKGTYNAKPQTLYIPSDNKDYASVKQAKSDDTKLVGEGALSFEVSGDRVTGAIESGPASPALIDATRSGDEIRGTVRRKDPSDQGLTGTFDAKVEGGKLTGTLHLAEGNASLLREAAFTADAAK